MIMLRSLNRGGGFGKLFLLAMFRAAGSWKRFCLSISVCFYPSLLFSLLLSQLDCQSLCLPSCMLVSLCFCFCTLHINTYTSMRKHTFIHTCTQTLSKRYISTYMHSPKDLKNLLVIRDKRLLCSFRLLSGREE